MKKNIFKLVVFVVFVTITLFACNTNQKGKTMQNVANDLHTAQNSLDWPGSYSGILPCADCDGIETELTLNGDLTYFLTSSYIGKEGSLTDTLKGNFTWMGNNVKLEGIPENVRPSMFKVEENQVRHLDLEGNEITGELAQHYVLTKNGNLMVEDKKWRMIELNGNPINGTAETHYIIFHSKDGRLEAKANCNVLLNRYKIRNELFLKIEQGISTMMACPDNLEAEFLQVLFQVDNLTTDGQTLSLNKGRMAPLARFELVEG